MANTATPVDIRLPTGELATVPATDLDQAVRAGAHVITQQDRVTEAMGGTSGELAAAALGAGNALTFGLGNQAAIGVADLFAGQEGAQLTREALAANKEVNPRAYLGGELAGMLVPGGMGEAYTGLGNAAERGALGLLGRAGVGAESYAARALASGVRGAAETSLMNVQNAISESALGNTDLNAQKLLAAATDKSVLLGGALGAGFGLGMAGIEKGGSRLLSSIKGPTPSAVLDEISGVAGAGKAVRQEAVETSKFFDDAAKLGLTQAQAKEVLGEVNTIAMGGEKGLIEKTAEQYAKGKAAGNPDQYKFYMDVFQRRAGRIAEQDGIVDKFTREWVAKGDAAIKLEEALNEAQFAQKRAQFSKLVDSSNPAMVRDVTNASLEEVRNVVGELQRAPGMGGSPIAVGKVSKALENIEARINGKAVSSADLYMELDALKQAVGKGADFGPQKYAATEAQKELRTVYDALKVRLEDESLFGRAGTAQRDMNATFSNGHAKGQVFHDMYSRNYGTGAEGVNLRVMDPEKVHGVMNSVGSARADLRIRAHDDWISTLRNRTAAAREHLDLSPAQQRALDDGLKAVDAMGETVAKAKTEAEIVTRTKQAMAEETGRGMGGVVGFFTDMATRPITTMDRLAGIQKTLNRINDGFETSVKRAIGAERAAVADEVVSLAGKGRDRVIDEIKNVASIAKSPELIAARAKQLVGDMFQAAPETSTAVITTATRMVQYLAMVAPRGLASVDLAGREKVRYSDEELHRYARVSAALKDPQAVLDQASRGRMSRDQVQAIRFVYPDLYQQMRSVAQAQVNELARTGKLDTMPYWQKVQIQTMLGVTSDGTTTPDFVRMMQASKAAAVPEQQNAPQQQQQQGAPVAQQQRQSLSTMKAPTGITTESDRLEGGGV
jgi:hypothetical protein